MIQWLFLASNTVRCIVVCLHYEKRKKDRRKRMKDFQTAPYACVCARQGNVHVPCDINHRFLYTHFILFDFDPKKKKFWWQISLSCTVNENCVFLPISNGMNYDFSFIFTLWVCAIVRVWPMEEMQLSHTHCTDFGYCRNSFTSLPTEYPKQNNGMKSTK